MRIIDKKGMSGSENVEKCEIVPLDSVNAVQLTLHDSFRNNCNSVNNANEVEKDDDANKNTK